MRISVTALLLATTLAAGAGFAVHAATRDGAPPPAKDQARLPSNAAVMSRRDYGADLIQLAQAIRPQAPEDIGLLPPPDRGTGPMRPDLEPFAPPQKVTRRPGPMPPNRASCEETIDRHAAMAGYIKSKLQLQGAQKEAWRKIEEAAEPAVTKLHQICTLLPLHVGPPPALPDVLEFAAKQTAARAEFLQAVAGPARALYDTLSPDQRAALMPPSPPPHGPF